MKAIVSSACAAAALAISSPQAAAQTGAAALAPSPPPAASHRLPAGLVVDIELAEVVSTKTAKPGDHFAIRTAEPLVVDGRTLVPAGAAGVGEVIDAAAGGLGGRPAKLILAARYIEYGPVRMRLQAFHLGGGGRDNATFAMALSAAPYVGLLAFTVPGGNLTFPVGTRANAKLAADVILPAAPDPSTITAEPPGKAP